MRMKASYHKMSTHLDYKESLAVHVHPCSNESTDSALQFVPGGIYRRDE